VRAATLLLLGVLLGLYAGICLASAVSESLQAEMDHASAMYDNTEQVYPEVAQ
jgi:hypothetical protein